MILDLIECALARLSRFDLVCVLAIAYAAFRAVAWKSRLRSLPLPPGPRPLPLVGNLFNMPKGTEGRIFSQFGEKYGPIYSFTVLGQTFIIVNKKEIAFDLLEKRSTIYSNRPTFTFGGEMVGFDQWLLGVMPYDDNFKLHRKRLRQTVGSRAALLKTEGPKEIEIRHFLLRMLERPDKIMDYINVLPSSIILTISHGYTVKQDGSDPLMALADEAFGVAFTEGCAYGNWIVDLFPSLKYLPYWLPGMGFKKQARKWSRSVNAVCELPFSFVKHQMAAGTFVSSFASEALEKGEPNEMKMMKCAATSAFAGGSDTTTSGLGTAFLAMTLYPEIFRRAQEEVDSVVGTDRLPTHSDRPNLPYIDAIVKEAVRWETILELNLPHTSIEEDVYMGYRIPKGAVIVANLWQMAHDPETYHDPFTFNPSRFLGENGRPIEQNPSMLVFGFGRRICPGKEFAESTLYATISMTVAVFNISKAKDDLGNVIEPLHEYSPGAIRHPKPFQCTILPRSEKAIALIRSVSEEYPAREGDAEVLRNLQLQTAI